ncbi:MAG: hypothetical protein IPH42_18390 [Bacteroidetes bacterium]|jgi:hypothetical protein|nr:hypothetical protein [Bacteroidota bacterium]
MTNKKNISNVDPEFGVDSRYKTNNEREQESIALMQARLDRMKNLSNEQILRAKLLQLKLKMENYLKEPVYDNQNHFSKFLETYVDVIYSKRSDFAKDINITANFLSKIINNHREPKEEFMLKLMIHSEKVFEKVGEFHNKTWYQIYFHEKLCYTMSSLDKWRPEIEKQIKLKELIAK